MKTALNFRSAELGALDEESRSLEISFSSEAPVERNWGVETLRHTPESVNTEFLNSGQAPLLADHNPEDQIGVVEVATIEEGRGKAVVRFGKGVKAQEWLQDVKDGIRTNISVGYRIDEMEQGESRDGMDSYLATRWTPMEISVVSIPADSSVGFGRDNVNEFNTAVIKREVEEIKQETNKEINMTDKVELNEEQVRKDTLKNEQMRTSDILAIGRQHSVADMAEKAVRDGVATNAFRESVLNNMANKAKETVVDTTIGLTETESRGYSLMKAIRAASTNNWSDAQFELECSNAVADKLGKEARGFYMPSSDMLSSRAVDTNNGAGAVGTDQGTFIDALRANSVLAGMGATFLQGLQGNVNLPKLSGTNASWVSEGGDPSPSNAGVGSLALAPKTLASYVDVSRRLMVQSDPSIEAMLRNDLMSSIATNLDLAAIQGMGGDAPTGITNTAGVGTANLGLGGEVSWDTVVDLVASVGTANAMGGAMSFLVHPTTLGQMRSTPKAPSTDSVMVVEGETLLGYPVVSSTLAPAGTIVFGNFNDLVIATWGSIDILVDPYSQSNTGATRLAVYAEADTGVRNAESFAKAV